MAGLTGVLCILLLVFGFQKGCENKTQPASTEEQPAQELVEPLSPEQPEPVSPELQDSPESQESPEAEPVQPEMADTIAPAPIDTIAPAQVDTIARVPADTIAPAHIDTIAPAVEEVAPAVEEEVTPESPEPQESPEPEAEPVQLEAQTAAAAAKLAQIAVDSAKVDTTQPALDKDLIPTQEAIEEPQAEPAQQEPAQPEPQESPEPEPAQPDPAIVAEPVSPELQESPDTVAAPADTRLPFMALRTNLLYDAVLVPNIGLEVWLGKGFTLGADWFGTWLYSDAKHIYWQGYGGYLTLRYYFGKVAAENRFLGHHVGLYGSCLTYDIEFGGKGYQAAKFGFGGGVEYGYSLYVGHDLSIDFNLGVGYQGGEYKTYQPTNDGTGHYEWLATYRRHWFGPTKAEISLKWLIKPMKKKQKGGEQ